MINFLLKFVLTGIGIFAISKNKVIEGIFVQDIVTGLKVAVVLALLNTFVRPILSFLSIPITLLTLGLFQLVINVAMVYATAYFIQGFSVKGFINALLFSFAVSIISWVLGLFLD
jgi:putative membrane protein